MQQHQHQQQKNIIIRNPEQIKYLRITKQILNQPLSTLNQLIITFMHSYSSRIYLYQQPVCSFNKLHFLNRNLNYINNIFQNYHQLCICWNNTQFIQELEYQNYQLRLEKHNNSVNTVVMVLQICQNGIFVHENYRINIDNDINFMINLCARYGSQIHIQYYTLRIPIKTFDKKQKIRNTLYKMVDQSGKILITVNSVINHENIIQIKGNLCLDTTNFYELNLQNNPNRFVIDKHCRWTKIGQIMKINLKSDVLFYQQNSQKYVNADNFKPQPHQYLIKAIQANLSAEIPLEIAQLRQNTLFLGCYNGNIYLLQQSFILYCIKIHKNLQLELINAIMLPCVPSYSHDEDLAFLEGECLVCYSITIHHLKVSYYTLDGHLSHNHFWPWPSQLYEIEFSSFDLMCVRVKPARKLMRIFKISNPQFYLQVQYCSYQAQFIPAKQGQNNFTDQSSHFAILDHLYGTVRVYNLDAKLLIHELQYDRVQDKVKDVIFSMENQKKEKIFSVIYLNGIIQSYKYSCEYYKILNVSSVNLGYCLGQFNLFYNFSCRIVMSLDRCFRYLDEQQWRYTEYGLVFIYSRNGVIMGMCKDNLMLSKKLCSFYIV